MPELPEMQALGERIEETFGGAPLKRIDVLQFAGLKTVSPAPPDLYGAPLESVSRRAKYLTLHLGVGQIMFHLSQGGRVDFEPRAKTTKQRGSVARFHFEGRGAFLLKEFGTERKAKWWVLAPGDESPLDGLGPEPFDQAFSELILNGEDKRRLHTMLRDQHTIAGIGRGFSDDILHRAQLSPFDSLSSLDEGKRRRLLGATRERLDEGLTAERERTGGLPAKLQGRFEVHGRVGAPCPRCNEELKRVSYESYEITYCPKCQTGGKILADRRLSRLLR
ncbi:MAG: hypothetical protein H0U53_09260 [Actinobacteria bacterium]|nr:hypothetical protein [Actinomycetota bacterium]